MTIKIPDDIYDSMNDVERAEFIMFKIRAMRDHKWCDLELRKKDRESVINYAGVVHVMEKDLNDLYEFNVN